MTLLLIRHGETPLNAARVLQPADTPLSELGHAQAAALARRLQDAGLAGIVSSDLPRARQTAEHLAQATGLAIETTPLLQERNFGDWRGLPYDTLPQDPIAMADGAPNGESIAVFEQRVALAFAHVLQLQARLAGPLAVVTHGLVVKAMLQRHATVTPPALLPASILNTALSVIAVDPPHAAERVNCTLHLQAGLSEGERSLSGG
jgi:probable phosphoglycerate mutase